MQSVLPSATPPRPLPGASSPKAALGGQPVSNGSRGTTVIPGVDQFASLSTAAGKAKSVQFGTGGKAVGFFAGGIASGLILWPLSLVTGLFGLIIHPLLPVAALMGVAPIGLAIWGAVSGAKSK